MIVGVFPQWILFYVILFLRFTQYQFFSLDDAVSTAFKFANIERCDNVWIPNNLTVLQHKLENNLYGQQLASKVILSALKGHFETVSHTPLTLSLHGSTGVGKTYVVEFIISSLYAKGFKSKFVHSYVASMNFPISEESVQYEEQVEEVILNAVRKCPKSLFVIDEVHRLQSGVLNKISSLIRYSRINKNYYDLSKAIFIFISNIGSDIISAKALDYLKSGIPRDKFKLSDFEGDIMEIAYEQGGLKESELMKNSFIDHFVPFLPLEEIHVIKCIKTELKNHQLEYLFSDDLVKDVIKEAISYGPEPHNLFSTTGCKRISQKLSVIIYMDKYGGTGSYSNRLTSHIEL